MSAGAVISQFTNLLNNMEALGPRLSSKIRPNRDQLDEIQKLMERLESASAGIESHVECLLKKTAPTEKERGLANRIRSFQVANEFDPALFRKNLVLIFRGPDESALDKDKGRRRKAKTRARCEKLRAESPHLILKWTMTLPPSTWSYPTVMADSTFDFLIRDLKAIFYQIPSGVAESLRCLKDEAPLKSCKQFQQFVEAIDRPIRSLDCLKDEEPLKSCKQFQQFVEAIDRPISVEEKEYTARYKRARTEQYLPTERELHATETAEKQMIERRTKEIDYKMSSMPVGNLPDLIRVADSLRCLKDEAPLKSCEQFQQFVEAIDRPISVEEKEYTARYKRARTEQYLPTERERHTTGTAEKQMIERRSKEIDYKMSSMPVGNLPHLIRRLPWAIESSVQWKWERQISTKRLRSNSADTNTADTTDCLNFFVPKDESQDISITLVVGRSAGFDLIYQAKVETISV